MAASAILAIKILADAKGAQKGMREAEASTSKFASGVGKASAVAAVGLAAVGAVMVSGVKAAAEDAQAQAVLAKTMENTTGATKDQVAAMEDFITKTSLASGVADDELRPALGNLLRATKDQTKAQGLLKTAMDISAATGKPLAAVSQSLSKGYLGNVGGLAKLGVATKDAKGETKTFAQILGDLQKQFGGAQAASAETAAGKMKRFQVALDEAKESAGAALLPALEKLAGVLEKIANFAAKNEGAFLAIAGGLAAVAAAVYVVNTALKVYRATMIVVQAVQAATFLTNPIFLVVAAVALLVIGIILLWKRSKTFRKIVTGAFGAVKKAAKAVYDWLKRNWPKLVAVLFGPFGIAVALIVKNWDKIKAAAQAVMAAISTAWKAFLGALKAAWNATFNAIKSAITAVGNFFKSVWNSVLAVVKGYINTWKAVVTGIFNGIKSAISAVTSFFKSAWSTAVNALKSIFNGLKTILTAPFNAMRDAVQWVIDKVQWLIDKVQELINKLPSINFPSFPDLNPFSASAPAPAPALTRGATTRTTAGAGGGTVININGALDPEAVARQIQRILAGHGRRVGTVAAI